MASYRINERWVVRWWSIFSFFLAAAVGLARYASGGGGNYDLGIFTQVAKSYAEGRLPYVDILGKSPLADHFSPITVLFAPGYSLWPDPRSLILTQAVALSTCSWVLLRSGSRVNLPRAGLHLIGVVSALALPFVSAATFDVHETGLGAPFVALIAAGLLEKRFRVAVLGAVGALGVKEDMGALVVMVGFSWWILTRQTRRSVALVALGVAGSALALTAMWLANGGRLPRDGSSYAPWSEHLGDPARLAPTLLLLLLAGVIPRGVFLLPALPTLLWRASSGNELFWSTHLHYDVIIAPLAVGSLCAVLSTKELPRWRPTLALVGATVVIAQGVFLLSRAPSGRAPWSLTPERAAAMALAAPLKGQRVIADQSLGTPLVPDVTVAMLSQSHPARARYVILRTDADTLAAPACAKREFLARAQQRHLPVTGREAVFLVQLPTPEVVILPKC